MRQGVVASGESATSRAFGADVRLGSGGPSLCLVVGSDAGVAGAVASAGGQVVTRLPGGGRVLALLTWEALQGVRAHQAVALAGAVTIDQQRFARFCALAGIDVGPPQPSNDAPPGAQED